MKVLIWIGTFLIGTILNTLLGLATGVRAGAVLLYIVEYFIARKLCEKWDEKQNRKKSGNQHCKNCGYTSFDSEGKCRNCGNKAKIEYDESVENVERKNDNANPQLERQQPLREKEAGDLTYQDKSVLKYCRKCGSKLIDDAEFCNKCGTKISEVK